MRYSALLENLLSYGKYCPTVMTVDSILYKRLWSRVTFGPADFRGKVLCLTVRQQVVCRRVPVLEIGPDCGEIWHWSRGAEAPRVRAEWRSLLNLFTVLSALVSYPATTLEYVAGRSHENEG